jgi:hypothetical protein
MIYDLAPIVRRVALGCLLVLVCVGAVAAWLAFGG